MSRLASALFVYFILHTTESFATACPAEGHQSSCETKGERLEQRTILHEKKWPVATVESVNTLHIRSQRPFGQQVKVRNQFWPDEPIAVSRQAGFRRALGEEPVPFQATVEDDLLSWLNFLMLFYVSHMQIGGRRADKRQNMHFGVYHVHFSERIDRELRKSEGPEVINARHQAAHLTAQFQSHEILLETAQ